MSDQHLKNMTRASVLWAAVGDALGFITERTDESGLKHRIGKSHFGIIPWRRKLGYRGPEARLAAGTYSDDTQLRIATSRAISDGRFDVDVFARVELPLWPIYALGAGKGSVESVRRLALGTAWDALVTGTKSGLYANGGGNGAPMRVQPLVWSGLRANALIEAIVENVACTHGHPKAFVGAIFHARTIVTVLDGGGRPPTFETLRRLVAETRSDLRVSHDRLGRKWIDHWRNATGKSFEHEWLSGCDEISEIVADAERRLDRESGYHDMLSRFGLFSDEQRGSATKTAALASALACHAPRRKTLREIFEPIVMAFGSDTDTIATMTGAIVGLSRPDEKIPQVQDHEYLLRETDRIVDLGPRPYQFTLRPGEVARATYDGDVLVLGDLGVARWAGETYGDGPEARGWAQLALGQTILAYRNEPRTNSAKNTRVPKQSESLFNTPGQTVSAAQNASAQTRQPSGGRGGETLKLPAAAEKRQVALIDTSAIADALSSKFDSAAIGRAILAMASEPYGEHAAGMIASEVVRLYKLRSSPRTNTPTPQPQPEAPRVPRPIMQMQVKHDASSSNNLITGVLGNRGDGDAREIEFAINGVKQDALSISLLAARATRPLEHTVTGPSLHEGMTVVVTFRDDHNAYEQDGVFQKAHGAEQVLLLKALDLPRRTGPSEGS